ncbi:MAG: ABC transporter permease [Clostridiaceae bacterium]
MFGTLFIKECKEMLKSITYYIFLACMILFFVMQMGEFKGVIKPEQGQKEYGYKYSDDKTVIMECTLEELVQEYAGGEYTTYPVGFYKRVTLNEEKQMKVGKVLQEVTGLNEQQLKSKIGEYLKRTTSEISKDGHIVKIESAVNYEQFLNYMEETDDLLGGGSKYSPKQVTGNAKVPKTYEDALKEYEDIIYRDKVSGAYARLFSDYMGIILAILPVFLAVTRGLRDKRSKASDVIFSKRASSISIVLSRYAATIFMILVPLLLLSVTPALQSIYCAGSNGVQGDMFAFVKIIFGWLLPTILVTVSTGFFFTELTDSPLAILVQGIWWFMSILSGMGNLLGTVGLNLVPRFNTAGAYDTYVQIFDELVKNRLFYSLISIVLLAGTVIIYELKRKGVLNIHGKIRTNGKGKLEV